MLNFLEKEKLFSLSEENVQTLLDWWKPSFGDLFTDIYFKNEKLYPRRFCYKVEVGEEEEEGIIFILSPGVNELFYEKSQVIPLFNENQLKDFIEEKIGKILVLDFSLKDTIKIVLNCNKENLNFNFTNTKLIDCYFDIIKRYFDGSLIVK